MQFVVDGPDIPNTLIQAHEEGRVVFFCGAGISYPAGLPGFKGLVEQIYDDIGTQRVGVENELFDSKQYDATLDQLERRLPGHRIQLRKALAHTLNPKLDNEEATATHEALLCLARNRDDVLHLVTTNFDRVFHTAAERVKQTFTAYTAPMLPIPKTSRWNGLVYLHGLLPECEDETALQRLVVTSGDFGLAYLTERWAARFVTELLRNYHVCFVGYGINDPVLRYMMDALAADRMQGENTPQAWVLGDCQRGHEADAMSKWEAKGVTPILYTVPEETHDHAALHKTLHVWAATHRDGVSGKERIVLEYAHARPSVSTQQDDFVGRMLWALSDPSGLPARRFAQLDPVPPLEWLLDAFIDERYQHADLHRFGISPLPKGVGQRHFSLVRRPAPSSLAPSMALFFSHVADSQWDEVMQYLACWLVRHLNDPRLIVWVAQCGGRLHDRWIWLIEDELDKIIKLEREGKTAELEEIRKNAPNAIPGTMMRMLWRLFLCEQVKSPLTETDIYRWKARFVRDGLTASLRLQLRELLAPKIKFEPLLRRQDDETPPSEYTHVWQLMPCTVTLAVDHIRSGLQFIAGEQWNAALPLLLDDFQYLLRDALDLQNELRGDADKYYDHSCWDLPSISPHSQNTDYKDWIVLIELLRDAWASVRAGDASHATQIALAWFDLPYPAFKRLALFAASQDNVISPEQWTNWLVADKSRWLWSESTQREVCRLLALQGNKLEGNVQKQLEAAILAGPPRDLYRSDIEPASWQYWIDQDVWLRLAKLERSGLVLSKHALLRLQKMSEDYPYWTISPYEKEEFQAWRSGTGCPDYEENRRIDIAPYKRRKLVQWLKQPPAENHFFYEDTWREVCQKHPANAFFALQDLAQEGLWQAERWDEALSAWRTTIKSRRGARYATSYVVPSLQSMPDDVFHKIMHAVSRWLVAVSKSVRQQDPILLDLCRRILKLQEKMSNGMFVEERSQADPLQEAINHPVGHVAQTLLNYWFHQKINDNQGIQTEIEPFFSAFCDMQIDYFCHGRVVLASNLTTLYRADHAWTEKHLLPLFNWQTNPEEARAVWSGFLWSPRWHQPLLLALKGPFLETAANYAVLGEYAEQYVTFLTRNVLESHEGYTSDDFRSVFAQLPPEGLENAAWVLVQALKRAEKQRETYWRDRIQPFVHNVWPKLCGLTSGTTLTKRTVGLLVELCIASGSSFPDAFAEIGYWLYPVKDAHYGIWCLYESGLCRQFPTEALQLLTAIIDEQLWETRGLMQCLDSLTEVNPALASEPGYKRLIELCRKRGQC